jgi:hypothetical protein
VHVPLWQVSVWVHAFPSLHDVPLGKGVAAEHWPVDGLHVPGALHALPFAQTTGFVPVHRPAWQVSVWVHAFPSEQLVPLALGTGGEHWPVAGTQVPGALHASPLVQTTGLAPVHAPFWHVSVWVQALPSLHDVPLATGTGAEHWPVAGLHVPAPLHWSPLAQTTGFVPVHTPA